MHLYEPYGGHRITLCRQDQYEYAPATNVYTQVTCPDCLVAADAMLSNGLMAIRPITNVVAWGSQAGEYVSVDAYVQFLREEFGYNGQPHYSLESLAQLSLHTGLSKEEIVKRLKNSGIMHPPPGKEKPEYKFNAGGTFGFGGL